MAEVVEEYTDSVEMVGVAPPDVAPQVEPEPQLEPELTIHDPAYWQRDAERLSELYKGLERARFGELDEHGQNYLIATMWKQIFSDHQLLKQLALETAPAPVKAPRKRAARVPKAALPSLEGVMN